MLKYDYQDSIIYWVVTTSHLLQRTINDELAPLGVTFRQAEVLAYLAMEGGTLSQAELARRMQVAAPTLGGIVARMERDGWIVRQASRDDRRMVLLSPTRRVEPLWEHMREAGLRVRARATRGLSPERVRMVLDTLTMVQDNLRTDESEPETST